MARLSKNTKLVLGLGVAVGGLLIVRAARAKQPKPEEEGPSLPSPLPAPPSPNVAPAPRQPARPAPTPAKPSVDSVTINRLYELGVASGNPDMMISNADLIESMGDTVTASHLRQQAMLASKTPAQRDTSLEVLRRGADQSQDPAFIRQQAHILEMEGDVLGASQQRVRANNIERASGKPVAASSPTPARLSDFYV